MSSLAASSQLFHKEHESKYWNTTVSMVLQPTMQFTGTGYLSASVLKGAAQLHTSFKSQIMFYLHYFLLSALPKETYDILTWFFKLPLESWPDAARLPNTAMWSLSRTTKEVPFKTLPDTESFSSSDLDKICSSSSLFCCRGIRTLYTESLESVKEKWWRFYHLLLWKNYFIWYGKRTSKDNKIQWVLKDEIIQHI